MSERHLRNLVRVLIGVALGMALGAAAVAPVPRPLPAIAIQQVSIYRLEVTLLVFYGWLLLATPAISGLIRGRLPTEISTRGARFAEETDESTKRNEKKIEELERVAEDFTEGLRTAQLEIEQLKVTVARDNAEPKIGSGR